MLPENGTHRKACHGSAVSVPSAAGACGSYQGRIVYGALLSGQDLGRSLEVSGLTFGAIGMT